MVQLPKMLTKYPYFLIVIILVTAVFKLLFIQFPFHGLEYEDAFVFSDVARYLQYNYQWDVDPFQTKSCLDGSISNCYQFGTFGGHYMILPLIVYSLNEVIGYSIFNIFMINCFASFFALYFYIRTLRLLDVSYIGICFSALLLVTTPFLNVFNTSGLSETFSSVFVAGSVFFYIKTSLEDHNYKRSAFWLTITFIVISFLTKRENLILLSLPVLSTLLLAKNNVLKTNRLINITILFSVPTAIAAVYNMLARINEMEAAESLGLGIATFNLTNFAMLFPKYLFSFLNVDYFGITGALFIITSIYVILLQNKLEFKLISLLSILYLVMYSSHYRSYYQVHFGDVNIFETLRYTSNYFPIACLCFGALTRIHDKLESQFYRAKKIFFTIVVIYISIITLLNVSMRLKLSSMEYENRINPAIETLKLTNNDDWILSDISSVFHLYANENRNFIDSYSTKLNRVLNLNKNSNGQIYLLKRENDDFNKKRYPEYFDMISKLSYIKIKKIPPNYELLKLVK